MEHCHQCWTFDYSHIVEKIITLWKSSNLTPATAPLTRDAMALQASPTKSGTLKILAASLSSALSVKSKCLKIQGNSVIISFFFARCFEYRAVNCFLFILFVFQDLGTVYVQASVICKTIQTNTHEPC